MKQDYFNCKYHSNIKFSDSLYLLSIK